MVLDSLARVPNIILAVTKECNLACRYCCYGSLYVQNTTAAEWKADMDVREYLEVLLKLRIKMEIVLIFKFHFMVVNPYWLSVKYSNA